MTIIAPGIRFRISASRLAAGRRDGRPRRREPRRADRSRPDQHAPRAARAAGARRPGPRRRRGDPSHAHPPRSRRRLRDDPPRASGHHRLRPRARRAASDQPGKAAQQRDTTVRQRDGPVVGSIRAGPQANVRALAGGETVTAGGHTLQSAYTPGHASHHLAYFDEPSRIAFVGDVAGVSLPPAHVILPPTPPPDVDVEAWEASVDKILRLAPRGAVRHPLRPEGESGDPPAGADGASARLGAAGEGPDGRRAERGRAADAVRAAGRPRAAALGVGPPRRSATGWRSASSRATTGLSATGRRRPSAPPAERHGPAAIAPRAA